MAVAYRSSTSTTYASRTNNTLTAPTGIQNNDILVIWFIVGGSSVITATPPAGFTVATGFPHNVAVGGFYVNCYVWWKVASGESGNYTVTHAANSSQGWIGAYSGADTTTPLTPAPTYASGTGTTSTATGLTTSRDGSAVIFVEQDWGDNSNDLTPPTGTTPTFTERITGAIAIMYVADGVLATAGPTGNKSITNNNSIVANAWQAALVAIQASTTATAKTLNDSGVAATAFQTQLSAPVGVRAGYATGGYTDGYDPTFPTSLGDSGAAATALLLGISPIFVESGHAVDSMNTSGGGTNKFLADSGVGAETTAAAVTTHITDNGAAADFMAPAGTRAGYPTGGYTGGYDPLYSVGAISLSPDSGQGSDTLQVGKPISVADSGTAVENIIIGLQMGDGGAGSDNMIGPPEPKTAGDSGHGSDNAAATVATRATDTGSCVTALLVDEALPLYDSGIGVEQLTGLPIPKTAADSATASESITIDETLPLSDSAICYDTLVGIATPKTLADTNTAAADLLTVANAATVSDSGLGSELLVGVALSRQLTDSGVGSDIIIYDETLPLLDAATAVDTLTCDKTFNTSDSGLAVTVFVVDRAFPVFDSASGAEQLAGTPQAKQYADSALLIGDTLSAAVALLLSDHGVGKDSTRGTIPFITHGVGVATVLASGTANAQIRVRTGQTIAPRIGTSGQTTAVVQ